MTLVAIYYSPATTHSSHQKVHMSSNNHTTSFSSKWKRGIAILSSKYHSKRKYQCSPTTVAAATEKVLCHKNNNNQHQQQVKCEDLTAKEFAKMAGIKIKTTTIDQEDEEVEEEADYVTTTQDLIAVDEPMMTQMTSISARTALSTKSCHRIWDSDFWQCNNDKLIKTNTTSSSSTTTTTITTTNNNDTLFISRLRSSSSIIDSNNMTVPGVIQKGRFKIVVGQDDGSCEPVSQHHHVVLEWKRKRSDSSSTNVITTKKK